MRVLCSNVQPLVQEDACDGESYEAIGIVQSTANGRPAKDLRKERAVDVDEWLDLATLTPDPTECVCGYLVRGAQGDAWGESSGAIAVQVDGDNAAQ